jgi:hypothetical protein
MLKERCKTQIIGIALSILFLMPTLNFSQNYQDCYDAFTICNKQTYHFKKMEGIGKVNDVLGTLRCSDELKETNSMWLSWTVEKAGIITFIIDPLNYENDLDFILFKKNFDCSKLEEVRCMAAGNTIGQSLVRNRTCQGPTGLSYKSEDEYEKTGCHYDSDNFLKFLSAETGEEYILLVNNFNSTEGFNISFEGDAIFKIKSDCEATANKQIIEISNINPNPATKTITISYSSLLDKTVEIDIFSLDGKKLFNNKVKANIGFNNYSIDLENYTAGNYLLRFTQEKFSTIRQFIKL